MDESWWSSWLIGLADRPWLLVLALIVLTFVLEDAATLAAVFLSVDGLLHPWTAWAGLVVGIGASDIGLYLVGRLGRRSERVWRWLQSHHWVKAGDWVSNNLISTTILARGIPGTRLPTYVGIGLIGVSAMRFALLIFIAVILWTSLIFGTAFYFSEWIDELMGPLWRAVFFAGLFILVFVLPRLPSLRGVGKLRW